ncbi:MAG: SsgA family sporulation/cell division regulator [Nakamurella sp.]
MSLQRIGGNTGGVDDARAASLSTPLIAAIPLVSVSGAEEEAVTATLRYSPGAPFLVRANFRMSGGRSVDWVLSRELLREGLVMAAGFGDIRFFPGDDGLLLELRSHQGRAFLFGEIQPLMEFVRQVFALVPDGAEDDFYSIDDELELLMDLLADPDRYRTDSA